MYIVGIILEMYSSIKTEFGNSGVIWKYYDRTSVTYLSKFKADQSHTYHKNN